ncbi:DUF6279 family lipoprotein [Xenophilus arseniciresistens]|uniref:DUF6279 family lipoprotein n=1 Tax=Xenophilus arseniciresistens TaxID=1283306 RepID=A0AAE3N8T2_9BURK|nr:DUF6279 family lipoprotein [Xenophilus arseniciresistens]MDA7417760.1 DUF6279 family lipoprotein [Xenophilus arseniciresistens]
MLCVAAVLASCSTVRLGYEQLPTLAYWWLDRHLDFDSTQSPQVREALAQWQARHRQEELPRLAALLEEAQTLAAGEITPEQACRFGEAVRARLRAAGAMAEAPAARIALRLGPAQTEALAERQARSNEEFHSDWLARSPAQQQARRYDEQRKRYEDFYGRLSEAQRSQLRAALARSRFDAALLDAERRRRQAELLALLRGWQAAPVSEAAARRALADYLDRLALPPPGPWREQQQALWNEGCADFAALHAGTSPEQRARAVQRLQDYTRDVQALRAAPAVAADPG